MAAASTVAPVEARSIVIASVSVNLFRKDSFRNFYDANTSGAGLVPESTINKLIVSPPGIQTIK